MRYVFLDRDGVLNRKLPEGAWVTNWEQFVWLPGALEALARMTHAGWRLIVVTNQRGVALGRFTAADLDNIHQRMRADIERHGARLEAIYSCTHERHECECRKPGIGLFQQAMKADPEIHAGNSVMIGDSVSDMEAGRRAGMKTIFIQGDPETQAPRARQGTALADAVANSLAEAVDKVAAF